MHTQSVTLKYLPQYEAYGISDEQINLFAKQNIIPLISLAPQDIEQHASAPKEDKPTIGFLLGRDENYYTIDYNYTRAILQSGVNIRFFNLLRLHRANERNSRFNFAGRKISVAGTILLRRYAAALCQI